MDKLAQQTETHLMLQDQACVTSTHHFWAETGEGILKRAIFTYAWKIPFFLALPFFLFTYISLFDDRESCSSGSPMKFITPSMETEEDGMGQRNLRCPQF